MHLLMDQKEVFEYLPNHVSGIYSKENKSIVGS
jgi:hypothetical protein